MFKRVISLLFIIALFVPAAASAADPGPGGSIARQIIDALPWDKANVDVTDISIPMLDEVGSYDDARVRIPMSMAKLGKATFPVSFFKNGVEVKTLWATARIKAYRQAVVSLKPLKANRRINIDDVKLTRVDVEDTQDSIFAVSEVAGMFSKRPIRAGEVIKKTYIKPERLVKRGDIVVVSVEGETIVIRSKGTATEDGSMGGSIGVRTASGREISGRVVGPGEIAVGF